MKYLFATIIVSQTLIGSDLVSDSDLLFPENGSLTAPNKLSTDQIRKDLRILFRALEEGYGGYGYLPYGETETIAKEIKKKIQYPTAKIPEQLCQEIGDILEKASDAHLQANLRKKCTGKRIKQKRIANVGPNLSPLFKDGYPKPWKLSYVKKDSQKVAVLSLTKFPSYFDKSWTGYLSAIKEAKKHKTLIIDLRGNGGGDDRRGLQLAAYLSAKKPQRPDANDLYRGTKASYAFAVNYFRLKAHKARKAGKKPQPYITTYIRDFLAAFHDPSLKSPFHSGQVADEKYLSVPKGTKPFQGKIFILIDAECGSSCETSLEVLESLPNATTLGENTAGFVHFGDVGKLVLPNSKIIVQIATKYRKFADERFVEKTGYPPQIKVAKGQDALSAALRMIKNEKN